ncbi:unnamed protein product [Alternaria alternata]
MHELEIERAESSDLRLKCAQLRRELEASKNSATQIIPRIVDLPEPLAIESTTMPVLEDSDEEVLDVPPLSNWKERTGKGYEIFVVDHTSEQVLKGYSFDISSSRGEAVSRISNALHQAASIAEGKEYHVATVLGKRIVNTDPEFLFRTIKTCQTLIIRTEKGIENWNSTLNKAAPSSLSYPSTITIQQATSQALEKTSTMARKRMPAFNNETTTTNGYARKIAKTKKSQQRLIAAPPSTSEQEQS